MYPEDLVAPMRQELVDAGFTELRTASEVSENIEGQSGTALIVVNSVCGCSAGAARPGVTHAVSLSDKKPDRLFTVFAGQDAEATEKARSLFANQPPSSPSIALMKDGQLAGMIHRQSIEGHSAEQVSDQVQALIKQHC